ncbi:papain family cysteine protease, putative, partial [Ichthyophthirius multifiliis]
YEENIIIFIIRSCFLCNFIFFFSHHKAPTHEIDVDLMNKWTHFKQKYNKKYSDTDFEVYRIQVFAENLQRIKGDSTKEVTQFMDLTTEEFKQIYLNLKIKQVSPVTIHTPSNNTYFDWQSENKVSALKDQGQCGSCWAFSTTGSVESALILAEKADQTINLSEQELIDCSQSYGNEGCNGGLMDYGFQYIIEKGLSSNKDYPYTAIDGICQDTSKFSKVKISKYIDVPQGNCNELKTALTKQPVSIAVDAEQWQFYSKGVLKECGNQLDHGVLLVGFVQKDKVDAWKIKNSWGTFWGENGYIYLADGNTCAICNSASYPSI